MKNILKYLAKAEGTEVTRHVVELDITAPYGIYKHAHPKAKIFEFINMIALECGIAEGDSRKWNRSDIAAINDRIKRLYSAKIDEYAEAFYDIYLIDAQLGMFPEQAQLAMFSMFTHSSRNAWRAVQGAINSFISSEHISGMLLEVDGNYGNKTESALAQIKVIAAVNPLFGFLFEATMIFEMSRVYAKLVAKNSEKYLQYLIGWNNRIDKLLDIR